MDIPAEKWRGYPFFHPAKFVRECLKTSKKEGSRANLQDDQIRTNLPDRPE